MSVLERLKPAPELRPYLVYSGGVHFVLVALALGGVSWTGSKKSAAVYSIDFVGGPTTVTSAAGGGPAPKAAELAPPAPAMDRSAQRDVDEFGRKKRKGPFVLPRPSLLRGIGKKPAEQPKGEAKSESAAPAAAQSSGGGSGQGVGDAGVSADMPDFPYPWYITQVRQSLWNLWSQRMPRAAGEAVIVFSILKDGSIVDLRTEVSSGDGAFDIAAMGAVQDASPFPRLPPGFSEPFLKIHVTLKSGG